MFHECCRSNWNGHCSNILRLLSLVFGIFWKCHQCISSGNSYFWILKRIWWFLSNCLKQVSSKNLQFCLSRMLQNTNLNNAFILTSKLQYLHNLVLSYIGKMFWTFCIAIVEKNTPFFLCKVGEMSDFQEFCNFSLF